MSGFKEYWNEHGGVYAMEIAEDAWDYRQTEVDELTLQVAEMKSRLNDAYTDGQSAMYAARQSKVDELQKKNSWLSDVAERENKRANKLQEEKVSTTTLLGKTIQEKNELQKRVDALTLALDQIAYPIPHMQKEAELNGCELNGYWAVKMSEDHTYSKDIARRALEKEQALNGGGHEF